MKEQTIIAARARSDEFLETALTVGVGQRCDAMIELARRADAGNPRIAAIEALRHRRLDQALRAAVVACARWAEAGAICSDPLYAVSCGLVDYSLGRQHRVVDAFASPWLRTRHMPTALAASLSRLWWASAASVGSLPGLRLASEFASQHGVCAPAETAWLKVIIAALAFGNAREAIADALTEHPGVAAYLMGGAATNPAQLLPNGASDDAVCGAVVAKGMLLVPGLLTTLLSMTCSPAA